MKKILFFFLFVQGLFGQARTVITTDGELDDIDSFIRMLLYSNEFKIEGLVISSSQWHYAGDGSGTRFTSEMDMTKKLYGERTELRWPGTQWIHNLVDAYGKVYSNLILHDAKYPKPEYLKSKIRIGNIAFEGEMDKDTDGSNLIKDLLLADDDSPIYLQAWGGTNTIARALKSIQDQYLNTSKWQDIYKKVCTKAIIYTILDQDATYRKYVSIYWPDIKVYYNANQFWSFAYFWKKNVPEPWHKYMEGDFMSKNILLDKGPLMKYYHSYGDGNAPLGEIHDIYSIESKISPNQWGNFKKYDFISEGDSPAFLHLVDMGLENLENPHYGGWGGKLGKSDTIASKWEDGAKSAEFNPFTQKLDLAYAQTRWVPDIQNDFAARAAWCVQSYAEANHRPIFTKHSKLTKDLKPGKSMKFKLTAIDPDKQNISYNAWHYKEAGINLLAAQVENTGKGIFKITIPQMAKKGEQYHFIFEAVDKHPIPLKSYKRLIINIL